MNTASSLLSSLGGQKALNRRLNRTIDTPESWRPCSEAAFALSRADSESSCGQRSAVSCSSALRRGSPDPQQCSPVSRPSSRQISSERRSIGSPTALESQGLFFRRQSLSVWRSEEHT